MKADEVQKCESSASFADGGASAVGPAVPCQEFAAGIRFAVKVASLRFGRNARGGFLPCNSFYIPLSACVPGDSHSHSSNTLTLNLSRPLDCS